MITITQNEGFVEIYDNVRQKQYILSPNAVCNISHSDPKNFIISDTVTDFTNYDSVSFPWSEIGGYTITDPFILCREINKLIKSTVDPTLVNITTQDILYDSVKEGMAFFNTDVYTLPSGGVEYFLVETNSEEVRAAFIVNATGKIYMQLYTLPTISDNGIEIPTHNRNEMSLVTSTLQLFQNPVVDLEGNQVFSRMAGYDKKSGGFSSSSDNEYILGQDSIKLLKVVNAAASEIDFELDFTYNILNR